MCFSVTGEYGGGNEVAVVWPGAGRPPLVLSVLTERPDRAAAPSDELVAEAARRVLDVWR